jgi:hypothetical protein
MNSKHSERLSRPPFLIASLGLRLWTRNRRILFFSGLAVCFAVYGANIGGPVWLIMFISGILLGEVIDGHLFKAPQALLHRPRA